MNIETVIQVADDSEDVPDIAQVKSWVTHAAQFIHLEDGEVTIRFVAPAEIQTLNSEFRDKDVVTNVLAFPFDEPPGLKTGILGDIAVCPDVVRREALEFDVPVQARYAHMIVHGFLHLNGFDHLEPDQAVAMETAESAIVACCGFADPWAGEANDLRRDALVVAESADE